MYLCMYTYKHTLLWGINIYGCHFGWCGDIAEILVQLPAVSQSLWFQNWGAILKAFSSFKGCGSAGVTLALIFQSFLEIPFLFLCFSQLCSLKCWSWLRGKHQRIFAILIFVHFWGCVTIPTAPAEFSHVSGVLSCCVHLQSLYSVPQPLPVYTKVLWHFAPFWKGDHSLIANLRYIFHLEISSGCGHSTYSKSGKVLAW